MQYYAEQLILFSKSSTSTTPLSSLHLPLPPNGHLNHHPIPNPNPTQPSQPHAVITAPLSTSSNGSNSSRTITPSFKKQPQETGGPASDQPLVINPHPPSNFSSASNVSSFSGAPKRPYDALGGVPAPVLPNVVNQSSAYHSQTHVPVSVYSHLPSNIPAHLSSSSLNSHSSSYLDPRSLSHYRSQPQLHSQPQQQQQLQRLKQRQHHNQRSVSSPSTTSSSLSSSFTGHMDDPDPDTDAEDADTSTDAGTETDGSGTDEELTIKAPPTVAGSVGSGASVGGGSVWGEEADEVDEGMASP